MGKVHGSLARAGKVRNQTPKVEKQEKKKRAAGRAKKRIQYNRRFLNVVTGGKSSPTAMPTSALHPALRNVPCVAVHVSLPSPTLSSSHPSDAISPLHSTPSRQRQAGGPQQAAPGHEGINELHEIYIVCNDFKSLRLGKNKGGPPECDQGGYGAVVTCR